MTIYFVLFLLPVLGMASKSRLPVQVEKLAWFFCMIIWILIIGLRHEIGCDWEPYFDMHLSNKNASFFSIDWLSIHSWEPLYLILNLISGYFDLGMYGVNTLGALIFVAGISSFCRNIPSPWLALTIATPYLIIVVGMGYSRQAIAIGLILWSISILMRRGALLALAIALSSVFFQRSAALVFFMILFNGSGFPQKTKKYIAIIVGLATITTGILLASKYGWSTVQFKQADTTAVQLRALLNAIPAAIFLTMWQEFKKVNSDTNIFWAILSGTSLIALIAALLFPDVAPTAIDRFGLYLIPLQLYVWSHLSKMLSGYIPTKLTASLLATGYGVYLIVWLNFSAHGHCWLPYDNLIFQL